MWVPRSFCGGSVGQGWEVVEQFMVRQPVHLAQGYEEIVPEDKRCSSH